MKVPTEPKPRRDLRCARKGCTKRVQPDKYRIKDAGIDPFCSTECCRAHYGVELTSMAAKKDEVLV